MGGSSRQPVMTAYRQRALACALALREGPRRPRDLRETAPDAAAILLRNVYGWFEREARGIYRLSPAGSAALAQWAGARPTDLLDNGKDVPTAADLRATPSPAIGT